MRLCPVRTRARRCNRRTTSWPRGLLRRTRLHRPSLWKESKSMNDNMVRVTFLPEGRTVEFEYGSLPYGHHGKPMSFLDVAEHFDIFLDHACGGSCACTTCHLWIKDGSDELSPADDDELDRLDMAADLQLNSRLGCQAVITGPGNYVVEIPKWNRNYVSEGKPLSLSEEK